MVEENSLENCRAGNGTVGSNPTLSANKIVLTRLLVGVYFLGDRKGERLSRRYMNTARSTVPKTIEIILFMLHTVDHTK